MRFYSLGGTRARCGSFASGEVTRARWTTKRGARVGTTLAELRKMYPRARFHRGPAFAGAKSWWLVTRRYAVAGFDYPALFARVSHGVVVSLGASYPSGGD
jgi:hypothetical protein